MKCFLCGSVDHTIFDRPKSFGVPLVYYQCKRCGLIFQSPEDSQAGSPNFYIETYRKIYQNDVNPTEKDLWVQNRRAPYLVKILQQHMVRHPGRILDIGASTGLLLETFQEFFNAAGMGIEPGDAYRAFAEAKGLKMVDSLDRLISSDPEPFDLVSMIHVLEHLPDPIGTLREIREQLLAKDGLLLVEVPNFYAHDSYELAHLACFTPHTLREVLKQSGFQMKTMRQHGNPRSTLVKLYITSIAQPLPEGVAVPPVEPEKFVRLKRHMGFVYRRVVQKLCPHKAWLPLLGEKAS